ncbi:RluA family pseudouridine synthase [Alicyclobacillus fodiniaquatilis]|uniref:RNA pseudouridylate synthase n=1 Tax=Alicyclobacillus fodiniaquatilis TaxID=1661150 RepID=A0ABW4JFM6_9BACL
MIEIEIANVDDGKKVHKWLRLLLPGMPLSGVHKFIRTGRIKVNGKRAKRDTILQSGDKVRLFIADEDYAALIKPQKEKFAGVAHGIDVRYEDDEFVIVNKRAGVLVHAADGDYAATLQAQVEAYLYHAEPKTEGQAFSPSPVHRLDRNTTGLVIFAKTSRSAREAGALFQTGAIRKDYLALVNGIVRSPGSVEAALARVNDDVTRVDASGKASATRYWPIASANGTSLLLIRLDTGRTHQIRAHMSHIHHPLIGDVKYGAPRKAGSTFYLHAAHLDIQSAIHVTAPLPQRFRRHLAALGYDLSTLDAKWDKLFDV